MNISKRLLNWLIFFGIIFLPELLSLFFVSSTAAIFLISIYLCFNSIPILLFSIELLIGNLSTSEINSNNVKINFKELNPKNWFKYKVPKYYIKDEYVYHKIGKYHKIERVPNINKFETYLDAVEFVEDLKAFSINKNADQYLIK